MPEIRRTTFRQASLLLGLAFLMGCVETEQRLDTIGPVLDTAAFVDGEDGLTIGHRLMDAGEYEVALKAYYTAGAEMGLNADVLSAIGSANLRLGRLGQAERILRRALDEDDRFVPAWNNLGVVLNAKGEFGEAREAFRVAFALDNGASESIRQNLQALDAKLEEVVPDAPPEEDFRLVRQGNGVYLLLGN
ncbi:MAG: tetratricopeptide repeat protein [Pseudomonadota bacterium]